jgi:hypothetical protein
VRRIQRVTILGGGSIGGLPCAALFAARREAVLTIVMANGVEVSGLRLAQGVVYPLEVIAIFASNPDLSSVELWALFEE